MVSLLETITTQGRPYARKAYPRLVNTYVSIGDAESIQKAKQAVDRWLQIEPDNPEACVRQGEINHRLERFPTTTQSGN
jgi:hypothetical protein